MPRTPVRRVGQESVWLQALVPWCSSCNGLMGRMVMRPREANYYRYYKRLGAFAKLATSYQFLGQLERVGAAEALMSTLLVDKAGQLIYVDGHMIAYW